MTTRLMACVAFGGDLPWHMLDVDRAAAELEQAGYEVFRLPDKYGGSLAHPLDDFLEAHIDVPDADDPEIISAILNQVDDIVEQYGGCVCDNDSIKPGYRPFADGLFKDWRS